MAEEGDGGGRGIYGERDMGRGRGGEVNGRVEERKGEGGGGGGDSE